jgi:hypothetical protein
MSNSHQVNENLKEEEGITEQVESENQSDQQEETKLPKEYVYHDILRDFGVKVYSEFYECFCHTYFIGNETNGY